MANEEILNELKACVENMDVKSAKAATEKAI